MGLFGVLIFIVVIVLVFAVSIATTLGPIALVIAAIVKSFRNSAPTGSPGVGSAGTSFTVSSERLIVVDPASPMAQAFGATLQQALGQQLGQQLLGTANSQDAQGQYLFAGYTVNTQPFVRGTSGAVVYLGDNGANSLPLDSGTSVQTGDPGSNVFMNIALRYNEQLPNAQTAAAAK